ncbi:MAG TPA: FliG C-terminal domain-containing protein [Hyphomonas sp.]|nr:hypothetical protein [Hyphomonas sp.]HPE46813.1 FliG C-terminal domain-containing protein [Hyphomonas sp.]
MSTQASRQDSMAERRARVAAIPASQRAAIIIAILGEAAAKPIVEKLDDVALSKVAAALENLSFIAREQMVDVVIDFLGQLRYSTGSLRGGKDKAREVLAAVLDSERLANVMGEDPFADANADQDDIWEQLRSGETVWTRLEKKDSKRTAEYLSGLSPNIIAMILRKLDVTAASDIVANMDSAKLGPVMGFMIQDQKADAGIDHVLERMVEIEFLNVAQGGNDEENTEHLSAIGEMLSLIPAGKRDDLVKFLQGKHDDKLRDIQKSLFTIESLPDIMPKAAVPVVMRELDPDKTLKLFASLRGPYQPVSDFLLANISSRLAEQLRDDLSDVKDLSELETDTVQREFLSTLMAMKRDGKIELTPKADAGPAAAASGA